MIKLFVFPIILVGALSVAVNRQAPTRQAEKKRLEDVVMFKVASLPEVKAYMVNAKASKPMLMIDREPDSTFKYYSVVMGVSNFDMFGTTERFCVDPKTLKIYFWDVFADNMGFSNSAIIPVQQWRLLRKTDAWKKPHTYKSGKLAALAN